MTLVVVPVDGNSVVAGRTDSSSIAKSSSVQEGGNNTTEKAATKRRSEIEKTVQSEKEELGRSPGEIAFFRLLHSEFKKATHFFDKAQQEFAIREERVREGMEIMKRTDSVMVKEKWYLLAKSIYTLYKDLLLLETFAIMTVCSFSKILKKHDKVTGHQTRFAFMTNVVSKANFTNYPFVLELIHRCESLYDEVSDRLLMEGLYEDERLFIHMISQFNHDNDQHQQELIPTARGFNVLTMSSYIR